MPLAAETNYLDAVSQRFFARNGEVVDQYFRATPLLEYLYRRAKTVDSVGRGVEIAINVSDPTNPQWIRGYEAFTYNPFDSQISGYIQTARVVVPLAVSDSELVATREPKALINKIDDVIKLGYQGLQAELERELHAGSGTNRLVGLRFAVDDGTAAATYAGISRTTYPSWRAVVDSTTTTLSYSAFTNAQTQAVVGAGAEPEIGLTTRALFVSFVNNLRPQERVIIQGQAPQDTGTGMREVFSINQIPIFHAPNTPANHLFLLDPNSFELYQIQGRDGTFGTWQLAQNQEVWLNRIVWEGALVCVHPRSNVKFTALTG
ncbi:MAG: phage major capsid protein [Candidatus Methanomethylicaceae archaeon]